MKRTFISIFLLLTATIFLTAEETNFSILSGNLGNEKIGFDLKKYSLTNINVNNVTYKKIKHSTDGFIIDFGKPEIPTISTMIAIPDKGNPVVNIKIIESEILDNINLYPQQELQTESSSQKPDFTIDREFYSKDVLYPNDAVQFGKPGIIRNQRVSVVTVNPFRYNPSKKQLEIIKKAELYISMDYTQTTNPVNSNFKKSKVFEKLFSTTLLNYENLETGEFQIPSILVIQREDSAVRDLMEEYAYLKTVLGFDVTITEFNESDASKTNIKSYLLNAYNNWENPPEYICIAGDATGTAYDIPTAWYSEGEGDHYYTLLDGDDILADAFIGRMSFSDITELMVIVNKIYKYELGLLPPGNNDWYTKALMTGDPRVSGQSCVDTKLQVKDMILDNNANFSITEEYVSNFDYVISDSFNRGISYFNYRGWQGMSGWDVDDIRQLSNTNKLPLAVFLTCAVGNFAGSEPSRPEELLRLGTPSSPSGAIAAIALATSHTHTVFNNIVDAGTYHTIFVEKQFCPSVALTKAKYELWRNFPTNPYFFVDKFSYWNNLMGDPSLQLWTDTPRQLNASIIDNVEDGMNSFRVQLTDNNNNNIDGVVSIISDSTLVYSGETENGICIVPVENDFPDSFQLMCRSHNYIPVFSEHTVSSSNLSVRLNSFAFINNNSAPIVNPLDNIDLSLTFMNHNSSDSNPVDIFIDVPSAFGSLDSNNLQLPAIASEQTYTNNQSINLEVSSSISDEMRIPITIRYTDTVTDEHWQETFFLYASAPEINIENAVSTDIDNRENVFNISLDLLNEGSLDLESASLILRSENSGVIISDSTESINPIAVDNNLVLTNAFTVSLSNSFYTGMEVQFFLKISGSTFEQVVPFTVCFGTISQSSVTGPDSYGYVCLEENDEITDSDIAYNWIEIENTGVNTFISDDGDNGDYIEVTIPIDFRFYGASHNVLTISSNGWVAPGSVNMGDFMNWHLPSICGPKPIIAAFWDDLNTGNVYYRYDRSNNIFIIEWKDMKGDYTLSNQTFQILLYDCNEYPTASGDSKIKIQYQDVNNDNVGHYEDYTVQHGNYATVGIQDYNASSGLEYTFNNVYPASASTLNDNKAIMFMTIDQTYSDLDVAVQSVDIINENGGSKLFTGQDVNIGLNIVNNSESVLTGLTGELQIFEDNIIIENSSIYFPDIGIHNIEGSTNKFRVHINEEYRGKSLRMKFVIDDGEKSYVNVTDLNVYSDSFELQRYYFTFDPNNELNNNDSLMCCFEISNDSPLECRDVDITVNSESGIFDINSNSKTIYYWEGNSLKYILFPIKYQSGMTNDIFECTMTISHENYSEDFTFFMEKDSPVVLLYNDFNSNDLLDINATNGTYAISDSTSFAGGNSGELVFSHQVQPDNFVSYLEFGRFSSINTSSTDLSFKYYIACTNGTHTLQISIGTYWHDFATLSENSSVDFSNWVSSVTYGEGLQKLRIKSEVPSGDLTIYIDDLKSTVRYEHGLAFFKGIVDSRIDPLTDDFSVSAITFTGVLSSDNTYYLATPPMHGWFVANCPGYKQFSCPSTEVDPGQVYNYDITMESVSVPENLTLTDNTNSLTLNWTCQDMQNVDEFIIYRSLNNELFSPVDTTNSTNWTQSYTNEHSLRFFVTSIEDGFESLPTDTVELILVGNGQEDFYPFKTELTGNYPNPFNPETRIDFTLSEASHVTIEIYNIKGQKVKTLADREFDRGNNHVIWKGKDAEEKSVGSGIYFYKFKSGNIQDIKKCILLK